MKFLCLICAEKVMEQMPAADARAALRGVPRVHRSDPEERPLRRVQPAAASRSRDHGARAPRQGLDHRRTLCRDQGAARWLLRHRGEGSERGDPGGGEDPRRVDRLRRGAADRGGRTNAARARFRFQQFALTGAARCRSRASLLDYRQPLHPDRGETMKYLCLVYMDGERPGRRSRQGVHRLRRVASQERTLHCRGGPAAVSYGDDRARPQRQGVHDRRTLRRDEGAARRVLSDRRQGPQ